MSVIYISIHLQGLKYLVQYLVSGGTSKGSALGWSIPAPQSHWWFKVKCTMQRCGWLRPTQTDRHCRTYACTVQLWCSVIILVTKRPLRPRAVKSLCAEFNKLYQAVYTEYCWWKPLLLLLPTEILAPCCQWTKRRNWPKSITFCNTFWKQLNASFSGCQAEFPKQGLFLKTA